MPSVTCDLSPLKTVMVFWRAQLCHPRLKRATGINKDAERYVANARHRIVVNAAAAAWKEGVPWGEALAIATKAISKANPKAKGMPKAKARS